VFLEGAMPGFVSRDVLYLKVDDANRDDFIAAGLEPFAHETRGLWMVMSLHRAPEPQED
jgi:TfoX/Sxy family transcriptional regulator of competence genes